MKFINWIILFCLLAVYIAKTFIVDNGCSYFESDAAANLGDALGGLLRL